jgi:hypothetical protein
MDLIREHLIYKDVPLTICMKTLKQQEQYEVIRLLLATRKNVTICLHGLTNVYVLKLLDELKVPIQDCSVSAGLGQLNFQ